MGVLKFSDDLSIKFREDIPSFKFIDDPKLKFFDDPIKFKFQDDTHGSILKAVDDVKFPAYDKPLLDHQKFRGSDTYDPLFDPAQRYDPIGLQTAAPFILSTPHHSMAWVQAFGAAAQPQAVDPQTQQQMFEGLQQQIKDARQQLQNQLKQLDDYEKRVTDEFRKQADEQRKTSKK